ncbi:MAG: hypothetical protein Q7R68_11185 [Nitrospirales bacterium]|nr:hypothetical protein [Nitrospirales bacterium]
MEKLTRYVGTLPKCGGVHSTRTSDQVYVLYSDVEPLLAFVEAWDVFEKSLTDRVSMHEQGLLYDTILAARRRLEEAALLERIKELEKG